MNKTSAMRSAAQPSSSEQRVHAPVHWARGMVAHQPKEMRPVLGRENRSAHANKNAALGFGSSASQQVFTSAQ
jgi:hypothetical protein